MSNVEVENEIIRLMRSVGMISVAKGYDHGSDTEWDFVYKAIEGRPNVMPDKMGSTIKQPVSK